MHCRVSVRTYRQRSDGVDRGQCSRVVSHSSRFDLGTFGPEPGACRIVRAKHRTAAPRARSSAAASRRDPGHSRAVRDDVRAVRHNGVTVVRARRGDRPHRTPTFVVRSARGSVLTAAAAAEEFVRRTHARVAVIPAWPTVVRSCCVARVVTWTKGARHCTDVRNIRTAVVFCVHKMCDDGFNRFVVALTPYAPLLSKRDSFRKKKRKKSI